MPTDLIAMLDGQERPPDPTDFIRHTASGAPYVMDPVKITGKGKPYRTMYGRISSLYKQIENATNLSKWQQRMCVYGLAVMNMPEAERVRFAEMDPDDPEQRKLLDGLARDALDAAQATLAAQRGTFSHLITEDIDLDRDPVKRVEEGEDLGLPFWLQEAIVKCWQTLIKMFNFEILAVEERVVYDEWRVAGTLDRIARLNAPLSFDGITEIPAGTIVVLDIKTGRLRFGDDDHPDYWHGYATQIAAYARSTRYVIEEAGVTEYREDRGYEIDTKVGLVAHLDIREALETGVLVGRLFAVNLEAGAHAGHLSRMAKEYERRRDLFQLSRTEITVAAHETGDLARDRIVEEFNAEVVDEPSYTDEDVIEWVRGRVKVIGEHSETARNFLLKQWSDRGWPVPKEMTLADVDAVIPLLDRIEAHYQIAFGPNDPRLPTTGHKSLYHPERNEQ